MNRGSAGITFPGEPRGHRFNEAPIHESGKSAAIVAVRAAPQGFNEAPIHESGKYAPPSHGGEPLVRASMRPRFMNRGSFGDLREGDAVFQLQ